MKLTSKDKFLLSLMAVVLIVVGLGYYVILPAMTRMDDLELEISDAEMEKQEMKMKITMLPDYQQSFQDLRQAAADATAQYYDRMTSQEVDREITNIVLSTGLESVGLSIQPAVFTVADPYSRSMLAREEAAREAAGTADAAAENDSGSGAVGAINEGMQNQQQALDAAAAAYEGTELPTRVDVQDQIYTCKITLAVEGAQESYQQLIDTLVNGYPAIRVTGITYQKGTTRRVVQEDGSTVSEEGLRQLVLNLDMYMCDKSLYADLAADGGEGAGAGVLGQMLDMAGSLFSAAQQTEAQ